LIEFVFAPRAEDDLAAIWEYLAVESGVALADRIQQEVVDRCAAFRSTRGRVIFDSPCTLILSAS